ncbi:NAD(P)/FAD-dependent oxidoreductase [Mycobacterium sp. 94-17]|uniref:flavin-containing monooxygenase n=1 Tax=Mycobacterium sp. 94-17 TaxID=2986147 RepID=UPI002D1F96F5|nr:NAD(P)/FAD-dependent oxidoreductase [Mycobacterium sp. 94-17]MEB4208660.1 NAD(P)/FAD-dependent oxidoreductase [Mycobacterium sp. 94-17]
MVNRKNADPSVAIIGGGFAGIAAGVYLTKAGLHDFTIFEKSAGLGGTWRDNTYPGAEVDVHSQLYSYSFRPHDWTRTHARQAELQQYLEDVVSEYGLRSHFRFDTAVDEISWDSTASSYQLRTKDGAMYTFRAVISAVGMLNIPNYPTWPGLDEFAGPKLHTARWQPIDIAGKKVAVVGTGSSAVQVVPAIAGVAQRVKLFQREPGWIVPKPDRDLSEDERARLRRPRARRRERLRQFWLIEIGQMFGSLHRPGTKINTAAENRCRAYISKVFADRPDLAEAVTPKYPFPGKRPVLTKDFYPALLREDVELVPYAVQSVTAGGVVDARGVEHPADVLVMATGFQPANYLASYRVIGRTGRTLHEFWDGEPQAFAGIMVPEFPNFYILYGPNTNGGEIVSALQRQAEFAVQSIKRLRDETVAHIEVRPSFYRRYNQWIQSSMSKTAWVRSNNYYKSPSGRVVTQWPYGAVIYRTVTKLLRRPSERVIRRSAPIPSRLESVSTREVGQTHA